MVRISDKQQALVERAHSLILSYGWQQGRADASYVDPVGRYRILLQPRVVRLERIYRREHDGRLCYVRTRSLPYSDLALLDRLLAIIQGVSRKED